ncbi:Tyrocidine synthase 3 [Blastopirellula retiformator]|uniref:Tyrocidine synthase 3 n=2 Tax=Blastopirellula retiformator TaxID=2527970 RepID=A0A5C5VMH9_9BACT|nr:Tyrocidine synthase 3 [Blastopirellula retiformator]
MIACPNNLHFVSSLFGCALAGTVAVPVGQRRTSLANDFATEIQRETAATCVLTTSDIDPSFISGPAKRAACIFVDELPECGPAHYVETYVASGDRAIIQYTSGSTIAPRGVVLTHENLFENQRTIKHAFGHDHESTFVSWLPLFHDMGLMGSVLQPIFLGAHAVIMPPSVFMTTPLLWLKAIDRYGGKTAGSPNFGYQWCVARYHRESCEDLDLSGWRIAFNGAESVRSETLTSFCETFAPHGFKAESFYPCYGLAESTLFVTGGDIAHRPRVISLSTQHMKKNSARIAVGKEHATSVVSCGFPHRKTAISIVKPESSACCPEGEIGEIWVSSSACASEYWRNPEATREVFGAALTSLDSQDYVRTGDLGFLLDNHLYVVGRLKDVILRAGNNYYAEDIEWAACASHPLIRPNGCAAFSDNDKTVIAAELKRNPKDFDEVIQAIWSGVRKDTGIAPDRIQLFLKERLPKTSSGKIQRSLCRKRIAQSVLNPVCTWHPKVQTEDVTPDADGQDIQEWLQQRLADYKNTSADQVAIDVSIFDLGFDSLKLMELLHQLEQRFQVVIPLSNAIANPSIKEISGMLLPNSAATTMVNQPTEDSLLTPGEKALWIECHKSGESARHNVAFMVDIPTEVEFRTLVRAINRVVRRHDSLRSSFLRSSQGPVRVTCSDYAVEVGYVDAGGWTEEDLGARYQELTATPFDLEKGSLFRATYFAGDRPTLLIVAHHLICDAWSKDCFLRELQEICESEARNVAPSLPAITKDSTMASIAMRQINALASQRKRLEEYWARQVDGVPTTLQIPTRRPSTTSNHRPNGRHQLTLRRSFLRDVERLALELRVSVSCLFLSAYQASVRAVCAQDSFFVGVSMACRLDSVTANTIGYLVNMLPIKAEIDDQDEFVALVRMTHKRLCEGIQHSELPFHEIAKLANARRDQSRPLLAQAAYTNHTSPTTRIWKHVEVSAPQSDFELQLTTFCMPDRVDCQFLFDEGVFDSRTVTSLGRLFQRQLECAVGDPTIRFGALKNREDGIVTRPFVSNESGSPKVSAATFSSNHARSSCTIPTTTIGDKSFATLTTRFQSIARRFPERVAVADQCESLSYTQLDRRSNRIAAKLAGIGCRPETLVGLQLDHSVNAIAGILGVLKTGAGYVPISADLPNARVKHVLSQLNVTRVIGHADKNVDFRSIEFVDLDSASRFESSSFPAAGIHPANIAYVISTSGSSGEPKFVGVEHRQVCALLQGLFHLNDVSENDVWCKFHSVSFDFSVWEIFGAICSGGKLVIADKEIVRCPAKTIDLINEQRVTVFSQVPSAFSNLVSVASEPKRLDSLKMIVLGGERIDSSSIEAWARTFGLTAPKLINMYGITETTVHVTQKALARDDIFRLSQQPIGVPLPSARVYLLDSELNPQAVGQEGEIYVGGECISRGYLFDPARTAERFVPDHLSAKPGARLYRTGDLARQDDSGDLYYAGRIDRQLKIRGHRIEPVEIEQKLKQMSHVRDAVVFAKNIDDESPLARMIAVLECDHEFRLTVDEIRGNLSLHLPAFMIPAVFKFVTTFPRTAGGKIDRGALERALDSGRENPVLVKTFKDDIEAMVGRAVMDVLRCDLARPDDDFFSLGGDSMLALRLVARCHEEGYELPLEQIFRSPKISDLARCVSEIGSGQTALVKRFSLISPQQRALFSSDVEDAYPASALQSVLIEQRQQRLNESYVSAITLRSRFDESMLRNAVEFVVQRHPMLRTGYRFADSDQLVQVVHRSSSPPIRFYDLRQMQPDTQKAKLEELRNELRSHDVELTSCEQVSFHVIHLGPNLFQIMVAESILDGWSVAIAISEMLRYYHSAINMLAIPSFTHPLPIAEFIQQEITLVDSSSYWKEQLANIEHQPIPFRRKESRSNRDRERLTQRHYFQLGSDATSSLIDVAERLGVGLKSVLLATHLRAISCITGKSAVLTGVMTHGRPGRCGADRTVGMFLNTLPFVHEIGTETWAELARVCQSWESQAFSHRAYPFAKIQRDHGSRITDFAFNFTRFHPLRELQSLDRMEIVDWTASDQTHFPVNIQMNLDDISGSLRVAVEFDPTRLDEDDAEVTLQVHERAIGQFIRNPQTRVLASSLLAESHSQSCDGPIQKIDQGLNVPERFLATARRHPNLVAVVSGETRLTYGELEKWAEAIASNLGSNGVRAESRVMIALPRSPEMVAAMLGTMIAGGCAIPVDIELPASRLSQMASVTQAEFVVGIDRALGGQISPGARFLHIQDILQARAADHPTVPMIHSEKQLSYIICTSGSSGEPKAVMATHLALTNRLLWMEQYFPHSSQDVVAAKTSVAFVDFIAEVLGPLCSGASIVMLDYKDVIDTERLVSLFARFRISRITVVPSLLRVLIDQVSSPGEAMPRFWISSGEPLPTTLVRDFKTWLPDATLINLYGSSETGADVTYHECQPSDAQSLVQCGMPISNNRVFVIGDDLFPVPYRVSGEICVSGFGLSLGYAGQPDFTASRFLPCPFESFGEVMFRTGDRGFISEDGSLWFQGRSDDQIKLRGQRLELADLLIALEKHHSVLEAACRVWPGSNGDELHAYVALRTGHAATSKELMRHLRDLLPQAIIPTAIHQLSTLPKTDTGKVSKLDLPAPHRNHRLAGFKSPITDTQKRLAAIWSEILEVEEISLDESFIQLGGHSLLVTMLAGRIEREFGVAISPMDILDSEDLEALAAAIDSAMSSSFVGVREIEPELSPQTTEMSSTQRALWLVDKISPGWSAYNMSASVLLIGNVNLDAIRESISEITARHESLRTVFIEGSTSPKAHINPDGLATDQISVTDSLDASDKEIREIVEKETARPFDLANGPLARFNLVQLREDKTLLLSTIHHIVCDEWSLGILVDELNRLYASRVSGSSLYMPQPKQMREYIASEIRHTESTRWKNKVAYWADYLAGSSPTQFPHLQPCTGYRIRSGQRAEMIIDSTTSARAREYARSQQATPFMVLLGCFQLALRLIADEREIVIGTDFAQRDSSNHSIVGPLVNEVVLRQRIEDDRSFSELVSEVRKSVANALANQGVSLLDVRERMRAKGDTLNLPFFSIKFVLQTAPLPAWNFADIDVIQFSPTAIASPFDLLVNTRDTPAGFHCTVDFNQEVYDESVVNEIMAMFESALNVLTAANDEPIRNAFERIGTEANRKKSDRARIALRNARPGNCGDDS